MRARPKLLVAVAAGLAALVLLPGWLGFGLRLAIAWNIAGLLYLGLSLHIMAVTKADTIAQRAEHEDESRFVILVLVLAAIASSFVAVVSLVGEARSAGPGLRSMSLALSAGTIAVSWTITQVVFAIHYAHEYYRPEDGEPSRGLNFPNDEQPDYWDFFYFSTSIGAASQTSDVEICSKSIRRAVTAHAVYSFLFNTTVLALAINLAAGLI